MGSGGPHRVPPASPSPPTWSHQQLRSRHGWESEGERQEEPKQATLKPRNPVHPEVCNPRPGGSRLPRDPSQSGRAREGGGRREDQGRKPQEGAEQSPVGAERGRSPRCFSQAHPSTRQGRRRQQAATSSGAHAPRARPGRWAPQTFCQACPAGAPTGDTRRPMRPSATRTPWAAWLTSPSRGSVRPRPRQPQPRSRPRPRPRCTAPP